MFVCAAGNCNTDRVVSWQIGQAALLLKWMQVHRVTIKAVRPTAHASMHAWLITIQMRLRQVVSYIPKEVLLHSVLSIILYGRCA